MRSYEILRAQSEEKLKIADHLIGTTYPLVREPKLLVSVIENISQSLDLAMASLLDYEKSFIKIPSYSEDFESRLEVFRRKVATKYGIENDVLNFIVDLRRILDGHKKSSVEFTRKEKLVITDNNFNMETLAIEDVKKKLLKAKAISNMMFSIIKY